MIKLDYEVLKKTKELELPMTMDNRQLVEYLNGIDRFIETLPSRAYELTKVFVIRDFVMLHRKLVELHDVLEELKAYSAANQASQLIKIIGNEDKIEIDMYLEKFIARLTTLSIDIQLVQYIGKEKIREELFYEDDGVVRDVLVVDDEPVILNAVKHIITDAGHKFSGATSAKAALRYLEKHKPDLCILDIEMPEMNGYELTEAIFAKGLKMPIIFLTGNGTRENVQKAIQIGVSNFLVKPVSEKLLRDDLKLYLGK